MTGNAGIFPESDERAAIEGLKRCRNARLARRCGAFAFLPVFSDALSQLLGHSALSVLKTDAKPGICIGFGM
ncbi:hypothetical protein CHL67_03710 [Prosthecochloris sp. GSB1]|nr:hypothetical protein CHL67_03710 [Prosthecochloris sp. GSB1]